MLTTVADFWSQLAHYYAKNTNVIFGLLPHLLTGEGHNRACAPQT